MKGPNYYGTNQSWDKVELTLVEKRCWLASAAAKELLEQYKSVVLAQYVESTKRGGFLELSDDVELAEAEMLSRMKQ